MPAAAAWGMPLSIEPMEFAEEEEEEESTDREEVRTDLSYVTPPGSPGGHVFNVFLHDGVVHEVVHVGPVVTHSGIISLDQKRRRRT